MHVVIGKGPLGQSTARLLAARGEQVKVLSRTPSQAEAGIEHVTVDATDVQSITEASRGAAVIYNCASPPYHRWAKDWPPLADAVLEAAQSAGAVLVTAGNLYGYGEVDVPMTEDLPLSAQGPKGRTRAKVWENALEAHQAGRVRATEARASDYFGPGVTATGYLASRMVPQLLAGRPVSVMGDPDAPHSWTYVPDIAATLVRLGSDERAWGRPWHVPTAPAISFRTAVQELAALAGTVPVPVKTTPWAVIRGLGLIVPQLRGITEIRYQFDKPFRIDSGLYEATFGERPTPINEALEATLQWWRQQDSVTMG